MPISQPDITINILPAQQEISNEPQRVLMVGQQTTGTATAGELIQSIENNKQEDTLFGANSMLAGMVRAFKFYNQETELYAIPLDDAGGAVAATGTIVFSGTATVAGTYIISIGSRINHQYEIAVSVGDTATVVGDALEAAVTADTNAPFSASNTTGTVTITAANAGLEGNKIGIEVQGAVTGLTTSITAMSGGATNPTLTNIFDVVGDLRFQTVVSPSTYDLDDLTGFLDPRFNVTNDVLDGVGFVSVTDTFANLKTIGNAENSRNLVIFANRLVNDTLYKGSALFELDYDIASQFASIRALRRTPDANIANYVIATNGARDSFGGVALSSFPYFNTPFVNLPLIDISKEWSRTETNDLNDAGLSIIGNNQVRNTVICGEVYTTYKTNAAGVPDQSFRFLNYVDTISASREDFFNNLKSEYAQCRLTEGDVQANRKMANEQIIKAFVVGRFIRQSSDDFVLTQAGEDAIQFFKKNLVVTLVPIEGKVLINMIVPIVVQLRQILATEQIEFSTNS